MTKGYEENYAPYLVYTNDENFILNKEDIGGSVSPTPTNVPLPSDLPATRNSGSSGYSGTSNNYSRADHVHPSEVDLDEATIGNLDELIIADSSDNGKLKRTTLKFGQAYYENQVLSKAGTWVPAGLTEVIDTDITIDVTKSIYADMMNTNIYQNMTAILADEFSWDKVEAVPFDEFLVALTNGIEMYIIDLITNA